MFEIKSGNRTAVINPNGAELHSLVSNQSAEEFMWSGDPAIWSGRAPILFPIIGGVKNDKFTVDAKQFLMKKHGFARFEEFTVQTQSDSHIVFTLESSDRLLSVYPWQFELSVEFKFESDDLHITYTVVNRDASEMAFNIGSHPAFRLPMEDADLQDYQIRFSENETLETYTVSNGLLERKTRPFLDNESLISLSPEIFVNDALVFKHIKSTEITLEHRTLGPRVRVSTGGAPHLGLWSKPAAPYVCIEPWWGHAQFHNEGSELANRESIQILAPGSQFTTGIKISTFEQ